MEVWGPAPRKIFQSNVLQNVEKRPSAEWNVAVSIIDLHAKMEKLAPLHSFVLIRTSEIEVQAGCF